MEMINMSSVDSVSSQAKENGDPFKEAEPEEVAFEVTAEDK